MRSFGSIKNEIKRRGFIYKIKNIISYKGN